MCGSFFRYILTCLCMYQFCTGCASTAARHEATHAVKPLAAAEWLLLPMPRTLELHRTFENNNILTHGFTRVRSEIDPARMPHPQGYKLTIARGGAVSIVAHDDAGVFYATQTLLQMAEQARKKGVLPECSIEDWPDFPNRGVMLDVARCKVPEMKTLYALVDRFASWKYNQLQLYTEHSFAYRNHRTVWEDASPMTPEQVRDLDAYCRTRHIQLIPNQNSFAHMGRWLMHPQYAPLAEMPGSGDLCPTDPKSIALLQDMYASLLPNFSSPFFNVGCDETFSIGKGRSSAAVAEKSAGRVYLEFLLQIHGVVAAQGKRMQFWADIINNHPDLIPRLPKDVVAMEWGYDKGHPYPEHTKRFHDNNVTYYVVPGTSSWNSLLGRTDNALANLREAAENGHNNGGEGFLVTDWGDGGHWQFLPVSYLPFAYGAGVSWCYDSNKDAAISKQADAYAFHDAAGVMGQLAHDLGNAHQLSGLKLGNNTVYYAFMQHFLSRPIQGTGLDTLKPQDLDATAARIESLVARLDDTRMDLPDADLIKAEYRMNAAMARFACHLAAARIRAGACMTSEVPKEFRTQLAQELEPLIPEFCQLWLARNRSGGLKESAGILDNILTVLKN
ncbi:MAG: family 20 glycosylhydrolase [Candidatus Hydrogenedentes bacterium]|nr:family 20 glycosylhydrolase [Candidatus Hydrogenedentota bacterium]